jgi:hypothetical protein
MFFWCLIPFPGLTIPQKLSANVGVLLFCCSVFFVSQAKIPLRLCIQVRNHKFWNLDFHSDHLTVSGFPLKILIFVCINETLASFPGHAILIKRRLITINGNLQSGGGDSRSEGKPLLPCFFRGRVILYKEATCHQLMKKFTLVRNYILSFVTIYVNVSFCQHSLMVFEGAHNIETICKLNLVLWWRHNAIQIFYEDSLSVSSTAWLYSRQTSFCHVFAYFICNFL